jgi:hypothetical protein
MLSIRVLQALTRVVSQPLKALPWLTRSFKKGLEVCLANSVVFLDLVMLQRLTATPQAVLVAILQAVLVVALEAALQAVLVVTLEATLQAVLLAKQR